MFQLQIKHPYDPTLHMIYNYPNTLYKTVLAPTFHVDDEYITSCNSNVTIIPKYDLLNKIIYIKNKAYRPWCIKLISNFCSINFRTPTCIIQY